MGLRMAYFLRQSDLILESALPNAEHYRVSTSTADATVLRTPYVFDMNFEFGLVGGGGTCSGILARYE